MRMKNNKTKQNKKKKYSSVKVKLFPNSLIFSFEQFIVFKETNKLKKKLRYLNEHKK